MKGELAILLVVGALMLAPSAGVAFAGQISACPDRICVGTSGKLKHTDFILEVRDETGFDHTGSVLEITEDAVMDDAQSTIAAPERLKESGIKLAIDAFGTG